MRSGVRLRTGVGYGASESLCESCTSALYVLDRLVKYATHDARGMTPLALLGGRCCRYGVGVLYADHRQYLSSMGLEPETNPDGSWVGLEPSKTNPLEDPKHPFNTLVGGSGGGGDGGGDGGGGSGGGGGMETVL